jgi:hypothetical protein
MLMFIVIASLILPTVLNASSVSAQSSLVPRPPGLVSAQSQRNALILSPISAFDPWRPEDLASIQNSLTQAGYNVTYLENTAVTLNLLTTQLNNYNVVIWRSQVYEHNHITYYLVGQLNDPTTQQSYASDFASGWLDDSAGILGASIDFFANHFSQGSLSNVKLFVLIASMSDSLSSIFLSAGANAIIEFIGVFSMQFAFADDIATGIIAYLSMGNSVANSVLKTVQPFQNVILEDPLDSANIPNVAYTGDSTVTIT